MPTLRGGRAVCNPSSSEVHSDVADVLAEVVRKRASVQSLFLRGSRGRRRGRRWTWRMASPVRLPHKANSILENHRTSTYQQPSPPGETLELRHKDELRPASTTQNRTPPSQNTVIVSVTEAIWWELIVEESSERLRMGI